jgi:hypothetical protein
LWNYKRWWVLKSKIFDKESTYSKKTLGKKKKSVDESQFVKKLGIISENKVVQKLKLENNVFNKKWSPKLTFLKKICQYLTWKIDFESSILAFFDEL